MSQMPTLTAVEFELVYNMLSLAIAAMLGSFAFFVMSRQQLASRFRPAMIMSSLVVGIAGYHYWRIFGSWHEGMFSTGLLMAVLGSLMYWWGARP